MEGTTQNQTSQLREGRMTKMVEHYTAQVPSIAYAGLALGGILLSGALAVFSQKKSLANFIGLWVPTLLLVGVYNKLVKLEDNSLEPQTMH